MKKKLAITVCCLAAVGASVALFLRPSSEYRVLLRLNAAYTHSDEYTGGDAGQQMLLVLGAKECGDITSASIKDDRFLDEHAKIVAALPKIVIVNVASNRLSSVGVEAICRSKKVEWVAFAIAKCDKRTVLAVCKQNGRDLPLSVIIECKKNDGDALWHLSKSKLESFTIVSAELNDHAISKISGFECPDVMLWGGSTSAKAIERLLSRNRIRQLSVNSSKIDEKVRGNLNKRFDSVVLKPKPPTYESYEAVRRSSYYYNPIGGAEE